MIDGELAKAQFIVGAWDLDDVDEDSHPTVECLFNPEELSTSKGANYAEITIPGLDAPLLQFVGGESEQMTLDLFFDATDPDHFAQSLDGDIEERGVTVLTDRFFDLVKMSGEAHAPPRLLFQWGEDFPGTTNSSAPDEREDRNAFPCVIENVEQTFTYFHRDGTPLRARLSVTLREYRPLQRQIEQLNLQSADHTRSHTVRAGETLPQIAHRAYGAPEKWRVIAESNDLMDARDLQPGTTLVLPPIEE